MASSNRHWPSMFKSKPCNTHHHHQWQHDINSSPLMSTTSCHRTPYTSVPGCEERSPEPKPRWNPKPEQIRILEAIFNSGMVNPPRDEIRKIRAQLQEYGQVGDANVFYWFQNRKSRSKHKLRQLQNSTQQTIPPITPCIATQTPPSSSSSSSVKSSPKGSKTALSMTSPGVIDVCNSPTGSVNQSYFQAHNELLPEVPFFFSSQQTGTGGGSGGFTSGFCFSELSNVVQVQDHMVGPCTSVLLSEMMNSGIASKKEHREDKNLGYPMITSPYAYTIGGSPPLPSSTNTTSIATVPLTINQIQGAVESSAVDSGGAARSTVFVNDVALEVVVGAFNVRETFGDNVVLIDSSGQPVLTDEWGVTLHPLQHGAFYYLVPHSLSERI